VDGKILDGVFGWEERTGSELYHVVNLKRTSPQWPYQEANDLLEVLSCSVAWTLTAYHGGSSATDRMKTSSSDHKTSRSGTWCTACHRRRLFRASASP
jgi:hypothetical protein